LGSQSELEGLVVPAGLEWNEPSHLDSLLAVLSAAFVERPANAGIVIGVTRNGRRHIVSRGVASKSDSTRLVNDSTLFEIGSITKPFTGVALAQAMLDGRLSLEQPIGEVLPASITLPDEVASISIEALATHSAGLPRNPPSLSLLSEMFRRNPLGQVTDRHAFESLADLRIRASGQPEYGYSNFGFMLLGRLLEEAAGVRYARLIEEDVTGPLGMTHTWVDLPESEMAQLSTGHRVGRAVEHWYGIPMPGASGVVSNVPDMLTFLEAHLHPETTPLAGAVAWAMEPRLRVSETTEAGLGWSVYTAPGIPRIVYHHGSTMGFRSYAGMAPDLGLGVVVLGNSRDITISSIGRLIMRTLAGVDD
jgi:CubicO group peptidase (beta-lactamase class C family)